MQSRSTKLHYNDWRAHEGPVSVPDKSGTRPLAEEDVNIVELAVDGRDGGAALAGAVQVLEGDGGGVQTGELGVFGVVGGEGERDGGVVDGVAGGDVRVQFL